MLGQHHFTKLKKQLERAEVAHLWWARCQGRCQNAHHPNMEDGHQCWVNQPKKTTCGSFLKARTCGGLYVEEGVKPLIIPMNDNPMKQHLDLATDIHSLPFFFFFLCHRPGMLTLTGQVGEVQEKSAQIALSWIRAHAHELQVSCVFSVFWIAVCLMWCECMCGHK